MKKKQTILIWIIVVSYILLGLLIGLSYDANIDSASYWLPLIISVWFSYNLVAYYLKLPMFFAYGSRNDPDSSKIERVGGAIFSAIGIAVGIYFWWKGL
ncbi:MAG: hypothetical protein COW19_03400 [Zetaproteobacteria bacterium CG12_big_fil_rev_8_21_14_0_65_55_1124]|nr:MAG: hypothetical protein AUJ58_04570 [Zetaproteobacteria bacterium CG1_02_55_237]PIS18357.1 MAG: hypothetical protein COT53_11150 [Zetaproteobacteria bacterium CG08_land_8_20_14_0_20_55_17]PIW43319.1 MAG: hypothetical protein COW19_03400 [Zetaproteobacteria bacterium CG12_big_fil_rev_8_21_14_0_65_55_1124]PIY52173.1 MAG: hypothetical protein COZ01_08530 [Zetaproteobacteria bacterium CG_4_10_14_0_8_um_filter_55_43]PIZ37723.1 MAG: hypothetical protein COY36_08380 [Zetaproteobacteria bacterium 